MQRLYSDTVRNNEKKKCWIKDNKNPRSHSFNEKKSAAYTYKDWLLLTIKLYHTQAFRLSL